MVKNNGIINIILTAIHICINLYNQSKNSNIIEKILYLRR